MKEYGLFVTGYIAELNIEKNQKQRKIKEAINIRRSRGMNQGITLDPIWDDLLFN